MLIQNLIMSRQYKATKLRTESWYSDSYTELTDTTTDCINGETQARNKIYEKGISSHRCWATMRHGHWRKCGGKPVDHDARRRQTFWSERREHGRVTWRRKGFMHEGQCRWVQSVSLHRIWRRARDHGRRHRFHLREIEGSGDRQDRSRREGPDRG
jgi:hypothetical protein